MHVHTRINTHTYAHTHTHAHIRTHTHARTHVRTHTRACTHTRTYAHVLHTRTRTYARTRTRARTHIRLCWRIVDAPLRVLFAREDAYTRPHVFGFVHRRRDATVTWAQCACISGVCVCVCVYTDRLIRRISRTCFVASSSPRPRGSFAELVREQRNRGCNYDRS